ncbi:MAG: GIY-YIG nuclease family protein, partial [Nitrososphaeraceae archaeon]
VYQIKNTKNQKIFVASTVNLKTMNGKRMMLDGGVHKNKKLQEEWNKFGEEAFVLEVLEVLKEKEEGYFDKKVELKELEKKWLEKLQPYDDRGYN